MKENQSLLIWAAAVSTGVIVATAIGGGWMIVRMPADYFINEQRQRTRSKALRIAKNVLGAIFLIAGLAMLVLPGPGALGIIIGIMLLDFPGKQRVLRWLIRRPRVLKMMNWLRKKFHKEPLIAPAQSADPHKGRQHRATR